MSGHTKGPWTVERHAPYGWNIRAPQERHLGAGTLLCELRGYGAEGDAALIAATPELLEALDRCNDAFAMWQVGAIPGRPDDILKLVTQVRAAIAKARGEE